MLIFVLFVALTTLDYGDNIVDSVDSVQTTINSNEMLVIHNSKSFKSCFVDQTGAETEFGGSFIASKDVKISITAKEGPAKLIYSYLKKPDVECDELIIQTSMDTFGIGGISGSGPVTKNVTFKNDTSYCFMVITPLEMIHRMHTYDRYDIDIMSGEFKASEWIVNDVSEKVFEIECKSVFFYMKSNESFSDYLMLMFLNYYNDKVDANLGEIINDIFTANAIDQGTKLTASKYASTHYTLKPDVSNSIEKGNHILYLEGEKNYTLSIPGTMLFFFPPYQNLKNVKFNDEDLDLMVSLGGRTSSNSNITFYVPKTGIYYLSMINSDICNHVYIITGNTIDTNMETTGCTWYVSSNIMEYYINKYGHTNRDYSYVYNSYARNSYIANIDIVENIHDVSPFVAINIVQASNYISSFVPKSGKTQFPNRFSEIKENENVIYVSAGYVKIDLASKIVAILAFVLTLGIFFIIIFAFRNEMNNDPLYYPSINDTYRTVSPRDERYMTMTILQLVTID